MIKCTSIGLTLVLYKQLNTNTLSTTILKALKPKTIENTKRLSEGLI
jgi:hypothetical protein